MRLQLIIFIALATSFAFEAVGQRKLTLEEAVQIALAENYNIQASRNDLEIAKNNYSPGVAGLLPTLDLGGNYNYSKSNTTQQFVGQEPRTINGAVNTGYGGSVDLGYTLFDGLGNVYNYRRLKSTLELVDAQTRANIENSIMDVVVAYYSLAREQENYRIAAEALDISNERLQRAKDLMSFGQSSRRNFLNVKVNYNTDSASLVTAQLALERSQNDLIFLLGGEIDQLVVSTDLILNRDLEYDYLHDYSLENNNQIIAGQFSQNNAEIDLKLASSVQMPRLSANASYGYNKINNDAGFLISNRNNGLSAGLALGFNIYDGHRRQIEKQNARIVLDSENIRYEELVKQTERNFNNAYAAYQNNMTLLSIEENSLVTAQQNFETTQEQNRLGTVTSTEFREAQLNLIGAQFRITDAKFIAKVAELELMRVAGLLLDSI